MSALQELQLLEIMCSCFQEQSRDTVRQLMFSALFSLQGNQADESRMALLGKLVSMAIAVGRVPILECAATWLQVRIQTFTCVCFYIPMRLVPWSIFVSASLCVCICVCVLWMYWTCASGCVGALQRTHRVYCVRLAQVLVDDYCSMVPGSVPTLQNIHSASPRFCCQFITAVTTLYDLTSGTLVGEHKCL